MRDRLTVSDLELWLRIGVTEEERSAPQRILVTYTLELNSSVTAETDIVSPDADYGLLSERLKQLEDQEIQTIERLAQTIATTLLAASNAERVTILVKKFALPTAKHVSLEITRDR